MRRNRQSKKSRLIMHSILDIECFYNSEKEQESFLKLSNLIGQEKANLFSQKYKIFINAKLDYENFCKEIENS